MTATPVPERLSLELSRLCGKACDFCYNESGPSETESWGPDEVVHFVSDLTLHGLRALSLGGGEPLEYDGLEAVIEPLRRARPDLFISMTTNGLLLDKAMRRLSRLSPNKVHVSIHYPSRRKEVERVARQVLALRRMGILAGVNLLVRRSDLEAATEARKTLWRSDIRNGAIMFLPMRGQDTPLPKELAAVAGDVPFQSMTCVNECGPSPRFVSVAADKSIAHCSYTTERRRLRTLDAAGLHAALNGLGLVYCGTDERSVVRLRSVR